MANPAACLVAKLMLSEISDCSSALSPEISIPFDVSKLVAIVKHDDPTFPDRLPSPEIPTGTPVAVHDLITG